MSDSAKEVPAPSLGRTIFNLLPLIILTWYLCNNRPEKQPGYQFEQCGKNLHTIGVALEKDRLLSDDKLYNVSLEEAWGKATPLPACPNGGQESYIEGYQPADDRSSYLLTCSGAHHEDSSVPSGYPRIGFSVLEAEQNTSVSEEQEKEEEQPEVQDSSEQSQEPVEEVKVVEPEESPEAKETPSESPSPRSTPDSN